MSDESKYEQLSQGVMGHFWPTGQDGSLHVSGHLQLLSTGQVQLTLFDRDTFPAIEPYKEVSSFSGATELGEVLFPDVRPGMASLNFGERFTTVARVRGEAVVFGVPLDATGEDIKSCSYSFDGIERWTCAKTVDVDRRTDGSIGFTVTPRHCPPATATVMDTRIALKSTVLVSPGRSRFSTRHIDTIDVELPGPADLRVILPKVHAIQGLVSIAFRQPVVPKTAAVGIQREGEAGQRSAGILWDRGGFFRESPTIAVPVDPWFKLPDIGGVQGLAEWVAVSEQHWRATAPLTIRYRFHNGVLENRFINAVMAIEYWVRNRLADPRDPPKEGKLVQTLIDSIGESAVRWVGDPDDFSKSLWEPYNDLKHGRLYPVDTMADLAESAEMLLLCSLFEVALSSAHAATNCVLTARRSAELGARIRDQLSRA